jgi:hypothetical protein
MYRGPTRSCVRSSQPVFMSLFQWINPYPMVLVDGPNKCWQRNHNGDQGISD